MAVLSTSDRALARVDFTQELMQKGESIGIVKADLLAAADALDDFLNTNATAVNQAIPLPARTSLTAAQKARLLMYVIKRRYLMGA